MKYIVFPTEKLNEIPQSVLDELHLVPRKSVDGTQVIMKVDNYEKLFPSAMTLPLLDDETPLEPVYPYPVYENEELSALLSSSEWSGEEVIAPVLETISPKTSTRSTKSKKTTVL